MSTGPENTKHQAAGRAKLAAKGGRIVQVRLRPAEVEALAKYREARGHETDSDAIRSAIVEAAKRAR